MLLTFGQFCENRRQEGRTFRTGGNYIQQSRLCLQTVWHFESKERLGKVCALRNGRHRLQSCAVRTDIWPVRLPLAADRRPVCLADGCGQFTACVLAPHDTHEAELFLRS